jgi:hypothetical protein
VSSRSRATATTQFEEAFGGGVGEFPHAKVTDDQQRHRSSAVNG